MYICVCVCLCVHMCACVLRGINSHFCDLSLNKYLRELIGLS